MQMIMTDHTGKYMLIDGHLITLSFSKTPNYDLFGRIKSILLSSCDLPHIRKETMGHDKTDHIEEA